MSDNPTEEMRHLHRDSDHRRARAVRCGGKPGEPEMVEVEIEVERTVPAHAWDCDGSCRNCPVPERELTIELDGDVCPGCEDCKTEEAK